MIFGELIKKLLRRLPLQNKIIFESAPDFSCNSYPVYQRLKEKYPDYKLVWAVKDINSVKYHNPDGVVLIHPKKPFDVINTTYNFYTCKAMISCNRYLTKRNPKQVSLYLCHGSKTKRTRDIYEIGSNVDFVQVQSHFFDDVIEYEYGIDKEQLVYLGYPRCDCFFNEKCENDEKYIIWLPTVRKRSNAFSDINSESRYSEIGMPLVYSVDKLKELNEFLKSNSMKIYFKPHPAQDLSSLKAVSLSNIIILTDAMLAASGKQLYSIIASSSALITDYSSVVYDYLLLDKPIATTTDDVESWKAGRGFAFDLEEIYNKTTTRVSSLNELELFILSVINGDDKLSSERQKLCKLTNMYFDGNSADRVVEFIMNKISG